MPSPITGLPAGNPEPDRSGSRAELTLAGIQLGELLTDDNPTAEYFATPPGAGSVIAIVGTDAPLLPQQCAALARRVTPGLARTGTAGSHFSGDLVLAFSAGNQGAITPGVSMLRLRIWQRTGSPARRS